ncbi:(2Fe-2S)-binding protein [Nakamurella sp.]|uniref:(2Fe-2S)-binding protein n=1 Tax=Nakamurella sp. TaxID=1869182 RepID=UPI003B3A2EE3
MPYSHARSTERDRSGRPGSPPEPLDRLAGLGPFFAVERHDRSDSPSGPWRPLDQLVRPGVALDARVRRVRAALAARGGRPADRIELRVAVSVAHLGLVARLIAPAVGATALGVSLAGDAGSLWWQDELGGPAPLSVAAVPGDVADPASMSATATPEAPTRVAPGGSAAGAGPDPLAGSAIEAITCACLLGYSVSPRVLWGNVASAAVSAAGLVGTARPELAGAARAAADAMLADRRVEAGALRAGPEFRRRSCCLIYRLAGSTAAVCGDCVITA